MIGQDEKGNPARPGGVFSYIQPMRLIALLLALTCSTLAQASVPSVTDVIDKTSVEFTQDNAAVAVDILNFDAYQIAYREDVGAATFQGMTFADPLAVSDLELFVSNNSPGDPEYIDTGTRESWRNTHRGKHKPSKNQGVADLPIDPGISPWVLC